MQLIPTGIPGFDDLLGGGLPKNRSILLQGEAGTGKSTFATQFLVNGATRFNENGLLLSLEYDPLNYIDDMSAFSWPLKELIDQDRIKIITLKGGLENPEEITVDKLINFIFEETQTINAKRVVIDSLDSLEFVFSGHKLRKELIRFTSLISELDCTSILINELHENNHLYNYLSHGVVRFYYTKIGANRTRAIEITKMRGLKHSSYTHSLQIQENTGIEVLPTEIDLST